MVMKHEWTLSREQLDQQRGVYFVDVLSDGVHACCVLNKNFIGDIRFVSRVCEADHVSSARPQQVHRARVILMDKSDAKCQIFVHFSTLPHTQSIILERGNHLLRSFLHQTEAYSLHGGLYVEREQLLEKKCASVVVLAGLLLNNFCVTNSLLKNTMLPKNQNKHGQDVLRQLEPP